MFFEDSTTVNQAASTAGGGSAILWLFLIVVVLAAAGFIYFLIKRKQSLARSNAHRSLELVYLKVLIPREASEDAYSQDAAKQGEKELIGIAEQLFATLSFPAKGRWKKFWHGQDSISFEIAAYDKKIHFYIICPRNLLSVVERQVQAQFPKAHLEPVKPYKVFRAGNAIAAAEFKLQKKNIYPIKTYLEQNTDPLNALTNAMSKLTANETASLQLVLTPAGESWGNYPRKIAEEIQKGKHPKDIDKSTWSKFGGELKSTFSSKKEGEENTYQPVVLTPMQQELVKKLEEKAGKADFRANIRIVATSDTQILADNHLSSLVSAFTQYNHQPFNGFKVGGKDVSGIAKKFILRIFEDTSVVLNTEELASLWHPPTKFLETPNIEWLHAKKAPAPVNIPEEGLLLGINSYRGSETEVRMNEEDRMRHMYIIGRTGTGKTELMKNLAAQDIQNEKGVCIIDPHGDFVEDIISIIPKSRAEDVIIFDPSDMERPLGLNMLEVEFEAQKDLVVAEMIAIFHKLFPPEMLGPIFEHNMRNVMLTLLADVKNPGTLAEIPRMFTDEEFQKSYVSKLTDLSVKAFWEKEMAKTSDFHKSEMLGYLVSKVGRFVENTQMRNIIGQQHSSFNFRRIMDEGKILLVNLSKGKIGEINAKLLGLIIVSKLQMAAMSRADVPEDQRTPFYLYVDEFQNFVTDSFATILSEARKYNLGLTVAHQYLSQLSAEKPGSSSQDSSVRDAVFGNVGSMVAFRVGVEDAEVLAREMAPVFNEFDVVNIERYHAYVKLMIHGTASRPFSMKTLPLQKLNDPSTMKAIKELSRMRHGRARSEVEKQILERSQLDKIPLPQSDVSLEQKNI